MTAGDADATGAAAGRPEGADRDGLTLRSGGFRLLWAGQTVSVLGDGMAVLVLPLLMLHQTGNPILVAFAAAPQPLAYLLVGLVSGPLVDARDSRRLMIWCDCLRAALFGLLTALVWLDRAGPATLLLIALLAAASGVVFDTAYAVQVQELLEPSALVGANSRLELGNQLGLLIGPALVGAISSVVSLASCLLLNCASYLVSVATLALLSAAGAVRKAIPVRASAAHVSAVRKLGRDLREGLRYLWSQRLVRLVSMVQTVTNFAVASESLVVFFTSRTLHGNAVAVGVVVSAGAAGGILGAIASAAAKWRPDAVIAVCITGLAAALLVIAAAPSVAVVASANAAVGGFAVAATVQIRALRQRLVPHELLGRVTAAARTAAVLAYPLGVLLGGLMTQATKGNPRPSFLVAGTLCLVCAASAVRLRRVSAGTGVAPTPDGAGVSLDAGRGAAAADHGGRP